jgi:hypothetical protein
MPRYEVEALEKLVVRTVYVVTARSPQQAENLCRSGRVSYEKPQIEEGDEEWIETVSITELTARPRKPQGKNA